MKHCIYCGDFFQCRDHVIPISYQSVYRNYRPGDTVACCTECNTIAGDFLAFSVMQKARFLLGKYERKLANMRQPEWTKEELRELDHKLREFVKRKCSQAELLRKKIENLKLAVDGFEVIPIYELTTKRNGVMPSVPAALCEEEAMGEVLLKQVPNEGALPNSDRGCIVCGDPLGLRRYSGAIACSKKCAEAWKKIPRLEKEWIRRKWKS